MTKSNALASLTRRGPLSHLTKVVTLPLAPDRIAFLGSACASTDKGEPLFVQSLCWPMVPTAWVALTHAWRTLSDGRGERSAYSSTTSIPASWVTECAPQLSRPFRGTTAAESSVAALLTRTPIRIAVTILDARETQHAATGTRVVQRQALSGCLEVYDQTLRVPPGRRACAVLVARAQEVDAAQCAEEEFARCRTRMPEATWLSGLQLRIWNESIEPLPLELAHLVAESVVRHQLHEGITNPIFDAMLTKMAHNPFQFKRTAKSKRR